MRVCSCKTRAAHRSRTLLFVHLAAGAAIALAALLFFKTGLRFWPCALHRLTGLYCLTCGATRAVGALLSLDLALSAALNPVPLLLVGFWLLVVLFEAAQALRGRDRPFRWLVPCVVFILVCAGIFCVLRNVGVLPPL
ncbi:MAG: DUF2752 domain-containing protein [Oscillospiraceae bacterium]|nr:DUF2752 domain-containing protein [Oscillospiraceae bacterium]